MRNNDEGLLRREMSAMAAEMTCDGYSRLVLDRKTVRYIEKVGGLAAEYAARTESEPLTRLADAARIMEACARETALEKGSRLPSARGAARIGAIMDRLCAGGDKRVTVDGMLIALRNFDDVQALTMAEYWAAPRALRISICRAWARVAESVIHAADERVRAEEWVYSGGSGQARARSSAFCERALQLAMELEKPELRARLEEALARVDLTPSASVRHAHEAQALSVLRIENITAIKRALDTADWQEAFERASRTEAELREDPARIYPNMTRESRAAVRVQAAYIARRTDMGETSIARCAVNAAREFSGGDVRGGVCWWLYDDEGRAELLKRLGVRRRLCRMRPDPCGYGYMLAAAVLTIILTAWAALACGSRWVIPAAIPLAWHFVTFALAQLITRRVRPRHVLRMDFENLPDDRRTLVVIPALISSPSRAEELCGQLERLGCLEKDPNLDFLLLGDFPDAGEQSTRADKDILDAARSAVARLNAKSERRKYHYLHRTRIYAENDGIYRGLSRKRGALMALGRLALGRGSDEFGAEGECAGEIAGRFRYVVTLDADTAMLPGAARELVSAIAHPLNEYRGDRGYAIMQPCVEIDPAAPASAFSRLFAGAGGLNTYSAMISDLFWDLAGAGSYCGKGIIDMPAFVDALEGKLDGNRILSHDLIEGMLARAGRINDVYLFDGFPATYDKYIARMERWTRGDWQLLPEIIRPGISLLDRYRIISNIIESLWEPALFALFVGSVWACSRGGFAVAAIFGLIEPIIIRLLGDRNAFRRGCAQLSALPATAYARADAIIRALYRTFVSKKHMLEWVASADAGGNMRALATACRAGAMLLMPGLLATDWALISAALAALFLIAPGWLREMGEEPPKSRAPLNGAQREMLMRLGRDTWRFFERYVTLDTNYLPPDNVQVEPDVGAAPRTSPTNIAMYLMSCVAAWRLGYECEGEMLERLEKTAATLERLEKWNGQLYNWYDIRSLEPLRPRYVSAVDSGNLAAGLLMCARAAGGAPVAERLERLARGMDFTPLYDKKRRLFHIGADVDNARLSESYYDLLASESRILSYTAIMLGQAGVEHWRALGRPVSGDALISWSGTMFEYFMPSLIMPSAPGTLMDNTLDRVIKVQTAFGRARLRPWGVSESGYNAFDMDLNYQYRAFGMRQLALGGRAPQNVVAPYAACLALLAQPAAAAENIRRMLDMNWAGECGLYEAADYTRAEPGLVKSWMSHHQGMALCAICSALTGGDISKYFMDIPEAKALEPLLNERAVARIKLRRVDDVRESPRRHADKRGARAGRPGTRIADACVLGGAGATAFITARGDLEYMRDGVRANRFYGDLLRRDDSIVTIVRDERTGAQARVNSADSRSIFETGRVGFETSLGGADVKMQICVSPETGALIRMLRMENAASAPVRLKVMDAFEVALMTEGELRSHPAFFRLFCAADLSQDNAVIYRRRSRSPSEEHMALYHVCAGAECLRETSWTAHTDREGNISWKFGGVSGPQLDPGSALCADIELEPGEKTTVTFCTGLCREDELLSIVEKCRDEDDISRQLRLAAVHGSSMADFAGIHEEKRQLAQRAAAFLTDPRLRWQTGAGQCPRPGGIPWDMPCVCVILDGGEGLNVLRECIKLHEYYRMLGLFWQLAIIDESAGDYSRPTREAVDEMIGACHLRDMRFGRGGVSVYDGAVMEPAQREAVLRSACMVFDGRSPLWAQLRRQLMALEYVRGSGCGQMHPDKLPRRPEGVSGTGYGINIGPGRLPPAPWCNVITGDGLGMLISERGGGFIWHKNSRLRRVTNFDNDPMREGWGVMLYVTDLRRSLFARALPGERPAGDYRVIHDLWGSAFETAMDRLGINTAVFHDEARDALRFMVCVENRDVVERDIAVTAFADWLMGEDSSDAARTRSWSRDGAIFASGGIDGVAYMACDGPGAECGPERSAFLGGGGVMHPDGLMERRAGKGGCALRSRKNLQPGESFTVCFTIGVETDAAAACGAARSAAMDGEGGASAMKTAKKRWLDMSDEFALHTGDDRLDAIINGFLVKQALDGRVRARAGFYQAGGAYGFRDQLQDMLALLPWEAERARRHILCCAEHQFASGDVMHWWHAPYSGVRTRISDDMLFLPMVTAEYIKFTGDAEILDVSAEYLADEEIPEGKEDWYGSARPSGESAPLREHCMRAFRRAWRTGAHGLLLMGCGDWNDGMNRVGDGGRGESVWLTMFFAYTADGFAEFAGTEDAQWLRARAAQARKAVEESGWDGAWYLRAYDDEGRKIGSGENDQCRIDLISQAWAVIAGLDPARAETAMENARAQLVDGKAGLIRLLTPPFTGEGADPGYIAAYPPGVRENGGQYTHAACWYLLAQSMLGNAANVREAIDLILPLNHTDTRTYRVEPYVLAGDVYGEAPYLGRGGWTWYTGAAGWFITAIRSAAGFERRGDMARLNSLRGLWERPQVSMRVGSSRYTLISAPDANEVTLDGKIIAGEYIYLADDGCDHTAIFPQRTQ